jgi:hypothetical protein
MPYELPNNETPRAMPATAPSVHMTLEERALMDTGVAKYQGRVAGFRGPVTTAAAQAEEQGQTALTGASEYGVIREAGAALRTAVQDCTRAVETVGRDTSLSLAGKNEAVARAKAARVASAQRIADAVLSRTGDQLLARFPGVARVPPGSDVWGEVQALAAMAEKMLPSSFLERALDVLQRATGGGAAAERYRANLLLDMAFLPLLDRFCQAGPKHWATMAGVAGDLADVVRQHLTTAFGNPAADAVQAYVTQARTDFTWLVNVSVTEWPVGAVLEAATSVSFAW